MSLAASLDQLSLNNSFAALPPDFYTRLKPRGLNAPRLLHANADAAALLGLDPQVLGSEAFLRVFAGLDPLPGGDTLAAVYSGHQFGVWAGQLGDGRAHLLGEVQGPEGNWELQLKGAGLTPYSRMGDGRAVLRSSVREYLAGEAMHGLGIPTTRALALVVSDDPVVRETVETAAIVTRMAPTFVRFGSFEHWASRRQPEQLRQLADYVIDHFYPACRAQGEGAAAYLALLREVIGRTARLMAQWQNVGFCHGVMNTDNMSILGLTLDYGPYGFMDAFRLDHICNHSDSEGRYAWNRQPSVALWNLYRLGGALNLLIDDVEAVKAALAAFEPQFTTAFHDGMAAKLGIGPWRPEDESLLDDLLKLMHEQRADFTLAFRRLGDAARGQPQPFLDLYMDRESAAAWLQRWSARQALAEGDREARAQAMDRVNPLYVLRNHLAENAIRAAKQGDASVIVELLQILKDPFTVQPGAEAYAGLPPDWASDLEVSCSS
ncbi:protein adenylyltransferase SelO [Achromobacter aloeverae]|uniref:Protein nucleotidyltransferase YdiU n=1 Tax=Achromobacter aloeverae TaxID=1750518 RepID=A0A4Q1HPB3_9BURK|nr:YdiU family protein [Achromobacter aloeverae]RXN92892.1 YdiU family protein [Achromobacter aloeverae]